MPSVQGISDLYCARYNGQWASEIRLDLDPSDGHRTGWDSSSIGTNMYYPNETSGPSGYAGNRKIWDNDEAYFYSSRGPMFGPAVGSYNTSSYPFSRSWGNDGDSYFIKHSGWSNEDGGALALPLPTYTLSMSGNSGWRSSGGSEPGSAVINRNLSPYTHTYGSWVSGYARDPIVVYTKPYIPDQTMTITSLTTANQYTPGNLQGTVLLKQPSIYANISLTSTTTGTTIPASEGALGFGAGSTIYNDAVNSIGNPAGQRYIKIVAYMSHWDNINDIEFAWNVTGAGASYFTPQNGTISNFAPITTSGWTDYAYGYQPINIGITDLSEKSTNINIVANGLKFSSGAQTKNYIIR